MNILYRTSQSHPLRIATLNLPSGGAIGVTFAPGKHQAQAMTGAWARDLDTDLLAIKAWGAQTLLSLLEPAEFDELGIVDLPAKARIAGLTWFGLPITDGAAPDERFLTPWAMLVPQFARGLEEGYRIVVHCKGGLGRAGTVACMLLRHLGIARDAQEAMVSVRAVRPGAIETAEQESFLKSLDS